MSDVNAKIGVQIDTSQALAELKSLQRQLALFHTSVSKGSASAAAQQRNMQQNLLNTINATGKFSAQMGVVRTSTESFTNSLEKNKFSMREYFRYAGGATKTFGRLFKSEFDTIGKVAEDRVKKLQTQYIKLGRDTNGAMQAISVTPTSLDMKDYGTKVALAAQKQALFNQLMKQGSTNLLNFGKNTQWAGRQLMVGFSVPLAYLGTLAAKTFMDLEAQAIRFKRVYGDMFTTTEETNKAIEDVRQLAEQFTKYGVAVADTMKMAADAAAMGKTGADLTAQVAQATRLAVLGGVEQGQALETTISITNAFGTAAEDLAKKINFLNSVENQTVVSIEDLTIAIPKAGPVVKQLGGDVEDLAFFLTAMKEGGINASEGANALKSGLAALINPTKKASAMLAGFGVNINAIVEGNQGNVRQTVIDFSRALDTLDPLNRARAIEQLFGKFQFSRLSTLFQNVTKDGTQASRVLQLAGASVEELAILSERELGTIENAVGVKFKAAIQDLKLTLEPIGKTFLQAVTPIAETIADLLDKFNNLGAGTKKFIVVATTLVGIIGPALLMTFGLLANGAANIIKLFLTMRGGFLRLGGNTKILSEQTNYLNTEQLEAATVAASLNQAHSRLTQQFTMETAAVRLLRQAYIDATVAAANFARTNPGMMMPGSKGGKAPKKFAKGSPYVPGTGNKDTVASLLTPGEAVIPRDIAQNPQFQPLIDALVSGDIKKYETGTVNVGGKSFTTRSQSAGDNLQRKIAELISKGYSEERIVTALEKNVERGRPMTASQLERRLSIGRGAAAGTSAPSGVKKLAKQSQSGFVGETRAIKKVLKRQGIVLTPEQEKNLFNVQASHVEEVRNAGVKEWNSKNLVADLGYVNNYLNTVKGKLGQTLLGMSDEQLNSMGIDRNELKKLQSGTHPTNARAAETLRAVARYDASINPNSYQAKAVLAGLEYRSKTNFYSQPMKTLADIATAKIKKTKSRVVDGQTGKAKSGRVLASTGAPSEKRQVAVGKGEAILSKKTTTALKSGKPAFVPGLGRFRMINSLVAGAEDGMPTGQKTGSTTIGTATQSARLSRAQLLAAIEKISLKEAKRRIASEVKLTNAMDETTKAQMTSKQKLSAFSAKTNAGLGALSGLTIAASFAGGKVGEMAQKIMPFVFGLQAISMLLPLFTNPWVLAITGITALVVGFKLIDSNNKKMAQKQSDYIDSISGTTEKMKKVGEITGKVGASQLMQRRREDSLPDAFSKEYNRAGQQFGTNFMGSEVGKEIAKGFGDSLLTGDRSSAVKQFALQLSAYVSDGVIDGVQAGDIARQLAVDFQDMSLYPSIIGQLTSIIGPDGADILKDPIKVRMQIINEQGNFSELISEGITAGDTGIIGKAETGKARSAAAAGASAAYSQTLELAKAQIDATNLQYEKDLEVLETKKNIAKNDKERLSIQSQITTLNDKNQKDNVKLGSQIAKILRDQETAFDKTSRSSQGLLPGQINFAQTAFIEASKKQVKAKFEGSQLADQVPAFLEATKNLKSQDLEIKINAIAASGTSPVLLTSLMSMFKGDEKRLNKEIDLGIKTRGVDETVSLVASLGILKDDELKRELFLKINSVSDKAEFSDLQSTLTKISEMAGKDFDVNTYLKVDGFTKLDALSEKLRQIENVPDPIVKTTQLENIGLSSKQLEGIVTNWEYFMSLPESVRKEAIQTYTVSLDMVTEEQIQAEITKRVAAAGAGVSGTVSNYLNSPQGRAMIANILAMQATQPQYAPGQTSTNIPGFGTPPKDPGPRKATVIDDLLLKLKLFRKESVNALGGWQELVKQLGSGKSINAFKGTTNQLQGAGGNESLVQFAEGLNVEEAGQFFDKITSKAKSGKLVLNDYGKSLNKLFPTVQAGIYLRQQDQITREQTTQNKALAMLRARGVDAATALELTADAADAAAIVSKDLDGKDLEKMINRTKRATAATKEFEKALRAVQFEADELAEGAAEKLSEKFDYAFVEIERKQREIFKSTNKMTPEQVELSIAIDEKAIEKIQDQINGINSQVKSYNRTLDLIGRQETAITETYDKKTESLNKQRDALESVKSINGFLLSQQQKQLGLANALTQGDISAAAAAAQEMRAEASQEAMNRLGTGLDKAVTNLEVQKQKELSSITAVVNGQKLTRKQIEAQIVTLSDQVYNIEVSQLEPLQKQADAKRQLLSDLAFEIEKQQKVFEVSGMTKVEWDLIQRYVDAANRNADTLAIDINAIASSSGTAADNWKSILASMQAAAALKTLETSGTTTNTAQVTSTTGTTSGSTVTVKPGNTLSGIAAKAGVKLADIIKANPQIKNPNLIKPGQVITIPGKMYGGSISKYMAFGGRAIGSDSVPAMLTPGEFVMNKAASKAYGPLLERINESKYPGMLGGGGMTQIPVNNISTSINDNSTAVYNYNLGFSINGASGSAKDIANAVMREIKNVDSQRIRGQRG